MNSEQRTVNSEQESDLSTVDCQLSTGRQIQALGRYVGQLVGLLMALQKEVEEMQKDNARKVTINHQQAKQLAAAIRERAVQICEKYDLDPKIHAGAFRSAIKKTVLQNNGVQDLHDIQLGWYAATVATITNWSNFSMVMKRRQMDKKEA